MSSSWPESSVSSDPSEDYVYNEERRDMECEARAGLRDQEHQIGAEAQGRHHTELYVMQTNVAVDRAVQELLSSKKLTESFKQVNNIVGHGKKRRTLVASICRLSASVRRQLGAADSEYGKFVRCKELPIVDVSATGRRLLIAVAELPSVTDKLSFAAEVSSSRRCQSGWTHHGSSSRSLRPANMVEHGLICRCQKDRRRRLEQQGCSAGSVLRGETVIPYA